ncbi:hypothetical protein B9Z55_021627 [Caenorhabditis nigoni]|uniref:Uncharacterized protein n=1 Tax=Caenorhabditis nigoni TaxID=1611254 RepID=A0A2G5TST5_9PELO|nr:hypothetical protein B9Z55_021627 [Caenorhabditis nigoni]
MDRTVWLRSQMNNKQVSIEEIDLEIRKCQDKAAETGQNQKNCYEFYQKYKKFRSERAIKLMKKQKKPQEIVKEKPQSPPRERSRSPDEFPNLSLEKKMVGGHF